MIINTTVEKPVSRAVTILILGGLIMLSPFSIDTYLPAFPSIATSLNTSTAQVGYSLTSYFAGLCVGQLVYGVLIDKFGRKRPLLFGLLIYLAAAVGCAFSGNIESLIVARLIMALGGCVGMVASRAIVRDLFPPQDTAKVLSLLILVMGLAPIIAPSIGGLVNEALGWRWIFGIMGLIALALLWVVFRILPETKTPDKTVPTNLTLIMKEYLVLLKNRTFRAYALAGGISFAGLYAYISGSPFVLMQYYGLSQKQFGWAFGFTACGLILGSQANRFAYARLGSAKIVLYGSGMLCLTATLLLLTCLLGLAGPLMILGFTFCFFFWLGMINPNATALSLAPFNKAAGRASALMGSLQMVAGVLASWLISYLHNGTVWMMPAVMLGCTLAGIAMLFPLYQKKQRID